MLSDRQKAIRRTGVTSTDMVALVGLSSRRTPHDVWLDKRGYADDVEETEAMSLGNELEPIIIRRLAERRSLTWMRVDPETLTMRHPAFAHHIATPDALFASVHDRLTTREYVFRDASAIGQVKATGYWPGKEWGPDDDLDEMPDAVLVQCAWELHVTGKPVEYVGALNGVTQLRTYRIERAAVESLIGELTVEADRFWRDHVLTDRSPPTDGSEGSRRMLEAVFKRNDGRILDAVPETTAVARDLFAAREAKKEAEKREEVARQAMMAIIGDADGVKGEGWRAYWKWRDGYEIPASRRDGARVLDVREVKGKRK